MWHPDPKKLVKVRLHNRGEDAETAWAEDLGPVEASATSRLVRLGNVLFLHAKPTYGDVIEARLDPDGMLDWDSEGVAFEQIGTRIYEDDGRWALIIDYRPTPPAEDLGATFKALDTAGEKADIAVEGCSVQKDGRSGRAYLAAPGSMDVADVLAWLRSPKVGLRFDLIHPVDDDET
jgi:hypothetical protein